MSNTPSIHIPSIEELSKVEPHSRAILVTNFNDSGEDVMNFTRLPAEVLEAALNAKGASFDECYEVPTEDVSLYCFEPNWVSEVTEARVIEQLAAESTSKAA